MKTEREKWLIERLRFLAGVERSIANELDGMDEEHATRSATADAYDYAAGLIEREALSDEGPGGGDAPAYPWDHREADLRPGNMPHPHDTPSQRRDALEDDRAHLPYHIQDALGIVDTLQAYAMFGEHFEPHADEKWDQLRRALSEPAILGNCMYCDKPVALGEQAEQHFSHATCDQQERESVEALEGEKMQPCWGDFMSRICELGITDPSEIAKVAEPAVPEAVQRLPDEWRHRLPPHKARHVTEGLTIAANELERALAQHGEGRVPGAWPKGWWCPHDHGFDAELGPIGCDLEGTDGGCVCQHRMAFERQAAAPAPDADERG